VEISYEYDIRQLALKFNFSEESSLNLGITLNATEEKKLKSFQGIVLTILNIVLSCILVLFLIYLIVLLKQRNDLKKKIRLNNQENTSELVSND